MTAEENSSSNLQFTKQTFTLYIHVDTKYQKNENEHLKENT